MAMTCAPRERGEVDRPVGVGRRPRLADGDDERVLHRRTQAEPRELGRRDRLHPQLGACRIQNSGERLAGDVCGALTDHRDPVDRAVGDRVSHRAGQRLGPEHDGERAVALDELAAQGLAEARGRLGHLLQQVVGELPAVDVAGRDLRTRQLVGVDRERRAVVREPRDALEGARPGPVEQHDLPATRTRGCRRSPASRRRAAGRRRSARPPRMARSRRCRRRRRARRTAPARCRAVPAPTTMAPARSRRRSRRCPRTRRPSRGTPLADRRRLPRRRDTSVGMTFASVVISGATSRPAAAFRSAKLSTSPFSAAVT